MNPLEYEGGIQRFEYTFELAWNVLKDRMEYDGIVLSYVTPRNVIHAACKAKLIDDCETWIDMLIDRNMMSHTYDLTKFEQVVENIQSRYLTLLNALYQNLMLERLEE